MAGEFVVAETNYCASLNPDDCSDRFRTWVRFLSRQSLVSTAMTADIPIKLQPLFDFYSNAVNSTTLENYKIIGDLPNRKRIVITVDDVNRILGLPRDNLQKTLQMMRLDNSFKTLIIKHKSFSLRWQREI